MAFKKNKSNNNGRGWWYTFADGTKAWFLGLSAQERRAEERNHGKVIERQPA